MSRYSGIVQSVEQRTVNPYVTGSSPVARAKDLCRTPAGLRHFSFICDEFSFIFHFTFLEKTRPKITQIHQNIIENLYISYTAVFFIIRKNRYIRIYKAFRTYDIRNARDIVTDIHFPYKSI